MSGFSLGSSYSKRPPKLRSERSSSSRLSLGRKQPLKGFSAVIDIQQKKLESDLQYFKAIFLMKYDKVEQLQTQSDELKELIDLLEYRLTKLQQEDILDGKIPKLERACSVRKKIINKFPELIFNPNGSKKFFCLPSLVSISDLNTCYKLDTMVYKTPEITPLKVAATMDDADFLMHTIQSGANLTIETLEYFVENYKKFPNIHKNISKILNSSPKYLTSSFSEVDIYRLLELARKHKSIDLIEALIPDISAKKQTDFLHSAIEEDQTEVVKSLLSCHVKPELVRVPEKNQEAPSETALSLAVRLQKPIMVKLILDHIDNPETRKWIVNQPADIVLKNSVKNTNKREDSFERIKTSYPLDNAKHYKVSVSSGNVTGDAEQTDASKQIERMLTESGATKKSNTQIGKSTSSSSLGSLTESSSSKNVKLQAYSDVFKYQIKSFKTHWEKLETLATQKTADQPSLADEKTRELIESKIFNLGLSIKQFEKTDVIEQKIEHLQHCCIIEQEIFDLLPTSVSEQILESFTPTPDDLIFIEGLKPSQINHLVKIKIDDETTKYTPLMIASETGDLQLLETMILKGANLTPEIFKYFLENNKRFHRTLANIHPVLKKLNQSITDKFYQEDCFEILHLACQKGEVPTIKTLCTDMPIQIKTQFLHSCIRRENTLSVESLLEHDPEFLEKMIRIEGSLTPEIFKYFLENKPRPHTILSKIYSILDQLNQSVTDKLSEKDRLEILELACKKGDALTIKAFCTDMPIQMETQLLRSFIRQGNAVAVESLLEHDLELLEKMIRNEGSLKPEILKYFLENNQRFHTTLTKIYSILENLNQSLTDKFSEQDFLELLELACKKLDALTIKAFCTDAPIHMETQLLRSFIRQKNTIVVESLLTHDPELLEKMILNAGTLTPEILKYFLENNQRFHTTLTKIYSISENLNQNLTNNFSEKDCHELLELACKKKDVLTIKALCTDIPTQMQAEFLHSCIKQGNTLAVQTLLEHVPTLKLLLKYLPTSMQTQLLHTCIREGKALVVQSLLEQGVNPLDLTGPERIQISKHEFNYSSTPIETSLSLAIRVKNPEMVSLIIKSIKDKNMLEHILNYPSLTPVRVQGKRKSAYRLKATYPLQEVSAHSNQESSDADLEIQKILVDAGAYQNIPTLLEIENKFTLEDSFTGSDPLIQPKESTFGKLPTTGKSNFYMSLINSKPRILAEESKNAVNLHEMLQNDNTLLVQAFLNEFKMPFKMPCVIQEDPHTRIEAPLVTAIKKGSIETVKIMLKYAHQMGVRNYIVNTPSCQTVQNSTFEFDGLYSMTPLQAAKKYCPKLVPILLEAGANRILGEIPLAD